MAPPKKPAKTRKIRLLFGVLGAVILVPVIGATALVMTFDPDKYRSEIADFMTSKLGRKVSLNGPMHIRLLGGPALEVNDVVLANAPWGARPDMAKIGRMALAMKIEPLFASPRRLEVASITLSDADVQLETNAQGAKNWELIAATTKQAAGAEAKSGGRETAAEQKAPLQISLDKMELKNIHVAMLDAAKRQTMDVKLDHLNLTANDKTVLKLEGSYNQQPFSAALEGGAWQSLLSDNPWAFSAQAKALGNDFSGTGQLLKLGKQIELNSFQLVSMIGSTVMGKLAIDLAGAKPELRGELQIDRIQPPPAKPMELVPVESSVSGTKVMRVPPPGPLFSQEKFDLSSLQAANAVLAVTIDKIETDKITLDDTKLKINLKNGLLSINPLTSSLAGNPLQGAVTFNANNQALTIELHGKQMNLQPVLQSFGFGAITLGKTNVAMDFRSSGDSPRLLANNLSGRTVLQVGSSNLPTAALGPVANTLLQLARPGAPVAAEQQLTCATARFNAANGVMTSDGILVDSSLVTVAGEGVIDLRQEQLRFTFQPQTKDAALNHLAAPVFLSGPLTQPAVKMDSIGAVAGLAETFLGKKLPVGGGSKAVLAVPVVNAAAADPCTEALDHPVYRQNDSAPSSAAGVGVDKARELVQDKTKGLSEKLDKALTGDQAPPVLKNLLGGEKSPLKGLFGQ